MVKTLTSPSTTNSTTPGRGPTSARAMGRAKVVQPMGRLTAKAVQKGGKASNQPGRWVLGPGMAGGERMGAVVRRSTGPGMVKS